MNVINICINICINIFLKFIKYNNKYNSDDNKNFIYIGDVIYIIYIN